MAACVVTEDSSQDRTPVIPSVNLVGVMNRPVSKERTDLLDIVRLTLDRSAGPLAREQLETADDQLASDARLHAQRWFIDLRHQTLLRIRELPEGADIDADTVQLVGDLLIAELTR
jgi:hypothetical protein